MKNRKEKTNQRLKEALLARLEEQPLENFIQTLFVYFPLDCLSLRSLRVSALEKLILELEGGITREEKKKVILQIIELLSSAYSSEKELSPITEKAVEEVEDWLTENFPVDSSLEEIIGLKKAKVYYISQQLKKNFGKTLNQYKIDLQIEKAKGKLLNGRSSISALATECGFCTPSYFSETFKKKLGVTPKEYRRIMTEKSPLNLIKNATEKDKLLFAQLPFVGLTEEEVVTKLTKKDGVKTYLISPPDEEFAFLHEGAVIAFKGRIFAAWYNNERLELTGRTPIRFSVSEDEGKTWSAPKTVVEDTSGNILYCPPVFGIQEGKLYMFLNQMVSPDCIHSLDLYLFDEKKNAFARLWSRPIPFKLNTNVYTLDSGKLMLSGRVGELDGLPETPAVMFSDSGKMDGEWRLVKLQENDVLPDGEKFIFPETSAVVQGKTVYVFCRNDKRCVPILYVSEDEGETWTGPYAHDVPLSSSKIYSGTLADGRNYVIGNLFEGRERLAILFTPPREMRFDKGFLLQDGFSDELNFGTWWHYPCAYEWEGKLYVVYTVSYDDAHIKRGLVVSVVDLSAI